MVDANGAAPHRGPSPRRWCREPLLHFALLAGLLFAADRLLPGDARETILISDATVHHLVRQAEEAELRPLSLAERDEVVRAFVEEEILYREAYRRGLDRGDSMMRRNLILKMRGLLADETRRPDGAELREYFAANQDRYARPPSFDLEHLYFSDPADPPADLADRLDAGAAPMPVGEIFRELETTLASFTQQDVGALFGADVAKIAAGIEEGRWSGPIASPHGVHFIRVSARRPGGEVAFEDVARFLEADWALEQAQRKVEAEVKRLRAAHYEVVFEPGTHD